MDVENDELLAEQRSYYRARAPEYDEWWQRRGRFERGDERLLEWQRQAAVVEDALSAFGAEGSVGTDGRNWLVDRASGTDSRAPHRCGQFT